MAQLRGPKVVEIDQESGRAYRGQGTGSERPSRRESTKVDEYYL